MTKELILNTEGYQGSQEDYDALQEAVKKLSTVSQDQFLEIQNENWYQRVFNMLTFSKKNQKRLAEQIGTVAQAQQILIELLVRLSANDAHISQLVTTSMTDIRRIQEQNIYLLTRINQLENLSLGVRPDTDIKKLSDKNKQVLSACLYAISENNGAPSDYQQRYANTVLNYLSVDRQMEDPLLALEQIDNEAKRSILICCMEYMFLKNCSADEYENHADFIDAFDFGNKTINAVKKQINAFFLLRGAEGLCSKYRADQYVVIDESFAVEFEETEEEKESEKDTIDADDESLLSNENDKTLEDEYITTILQVPAGDTKVFCNKKVHIRSFVKCEGNLEFNHCILYYNEEERNEISMAQNTTLSILNSVVVCKGYDENIFIKGNSGSSFLFHNSRFEDCSYFFRGESNSKLDMTGCELLNCLMNFIDIDHADSGVISDNIINLNNKKEFYRYANAYRGNIIKSKYSKLKIYNNTFVESDGFKSCRMYKAKTQYLSDSYNEICCISADSDAEIKECCFCGITTGIKVHHVEKCQFKNCQACIEIVDCYSEPFGYVKDCLFDASTKTVAASKKTSITSCQFINCFDRLIYPKNLDEITIENCIFKNIKNSLTTSFCYTDSWNASICFRRGRGNDYDASSIKKCSFESVVLSEKNYLIAALGHEKPSGSGLVASVENCQFSNCTTDREDKGIININMKIDTLMKKDIDYHAIGVWDCNGINREGILI